MQKGNTTVFAKQRNKMQNRRYLVKKNSLINKSNRIRYHFRNSKLKHRYVPESIKTHNIITKFRILIVIKHKIGILWTRICLVPEFLWTCTCICTSMFRNIYGHMYEYVPKYIWTHVLVCSEILMDISTSVFWNIYGHMQLCSGIILDTYNAFSGIQAWDDTV